MATKYDEYFKKGCSLSDSAIRFLEQAKGVPCVSLKTDKNGKHRIYVSYPEKVRGAGSNSWIAMRTQYIGSPNKNRTAKRLELEAMVIMAVGAKNKPALLWVKNNQGIA